MQQLILIRHAATDMAGTLCGESDPPLNSIGREQADMLALSLRGSGFRRLYTSDLQRAIQTAQALARLWDVDIVTRAELREIRFGRWEGKCWSQILMERPDMTPPKTVREFCTPGGELFECFRERVLRVIDEIVTECDGEPAPVVTHLGVILLALNEISSGSQVLPAPQRIGHCSIHYISFEAGLKLPLVEPT